MKYLHATINTALVAMLLAAGSVHSAPYNPMMPKHKAPAKNYLGASVGITKSDPLCDDFVRCEDEDQSYKAYSGVRLNDNVIIEGGYIQFGELSAYDGNGNRSVSSLSGYTTAGLATFQYGEQIELFGKGGMLWWDNELSTAAGNRENSGSTTFLGVGANYDMGDNLGIRAEWERFEGLDRFQTEKKDAMDLISVGVTFSSL